jgi:hypothetical protein
MADLNIILIAVSVFQIALGAVRVERTVRVQWTPRNTSVLRGMYLLGVFGPAEN